MQLYWKARESEEVTDNMTPKRHKGKLLFPYFLALILVVNNISPL